MFPKDAHVLILPMNPLPCVAVLVYEGCYHQAPQTGGPERQKLIFSQIWRQNVQDRVCFFRGLSPWPGDAEVIPFPCRHIVFPLDVCVQIFSYKDTRHIAWGSS